LRGPVDLAAPLSLSSGGLADRSDWERGRPPCSLGVSLVVFAVLPQRSFTLMSSGGADLRWGLSPRRRPGPDPTRASSISSGLADLGSKVGGAGVSRHGVGRKGIRPLLSSGGLIRDGGIRIKLDLLLLPSMVAGIGVALLLPLCAVPFLLLPPLLASHGGKGQGMGSGDATGLQGSSVEAYGCGASRSSLLCSGKLP
jgi:hypothetical protein